MLGIGKSNSPWTWTGHGKHTVARDYFSVGPEEPLSRAFSDWVDGGLHSLSEDRTALTQPTAYRFWAKGLKKNSLACGVIRNSCDTIGRPFPLLLMGCGSLDKFEDKWSLMPLSCEGCWQQLEHLATRRLNSFDQLQIELTKIKKPNDSWAEMEETMRADFAMPGNLGRAISDLEISGATFIPLWGEEVSDPMLLASQFHLALQHNMKKPPFAVFIGGFNRLNMAVFNRPMQVSDFTQLWQTSYS